ncbi:MFS transporter [Cellulosimicrobium sp. NPDC057127]|uniref:MFS transporter n=1 Tax=Cellulosimicrobium sp. NPDC057127 TaxID=3346026 RepID=UPI00363E2786
MPLLVAGTALIAATYGLVRFAYGLYLPDVEHDLGLDVAAAGLVSGGASVVYCVGALVGFLAAGRHARALVVAAALGAAVGALGMALAPSAGAFAVFAVASSSGAGLASPALVAVLQRDPRTRGRPRAQTVVNSGTGPGVVAAGVLALVLLPHWRAAWVVAAAVALVAGVLVLVTAHARGTAPSRASLPPRPWFAAHGRVLLAALLLGGGSAAVWNYGRALLVASGTGETVSVAAWLALGTGGAAAAATAGWAERRGPRTSWLLTTSTVAGASAALAVAPGSTPLALVACAAFGWGYTAGTGALIAWTARIDPPRAPSGTALLFVTLVLGQALGAAAVGALVPTAGYPVAFLVAAATAAVGALMALGRTAAGQPAARAAST